MVMPRQVHSAGVDPGSSGERTRATCLDPRAWKEHLTFTWSSGNLCVVTTVVFADHMKGFHVLGSTVCGRMELTRFETSIVEGWVLFPPWSAIPAGGAPVVFTNRRAGATSLGAPVPAWVGGWRWGQIRHPALYDLMDSLRGSRIQ